MLQDVYHSGEYQNIQIAVTDEVKEYLTENGYDEKYGARPLRRLIQRSIEDEIAEAFLKEEIVPGDHITLVMEQGKPSIRKDA